jgi:hypothetical protein
MVWSVTLNLHAHPAHYGGRRLWSLHHRLWHVRTPTKCTGIINKPWVMLTALGCVQSIVGVSTAPCTTPSVLL